MTTWPDESRICTKCRRLRQKPLKTGKCRDCTPSWSANHPKKIAAENRARARVKAAAALRRGKLTKQPCEHCGAEKAQMHHPDYRKPLAVIWLCPPCHYAEHRRLRIAA